MTRREGGQKNPTVYIFNKSKSCQLGLDPTMPPLAARELQGATFRCGLKNGGAPFVGQPFVCNVQNRDHFIGPEDGKVDDNGLFRSLMAEPASHAVLCRNHHEIRALGVPAENVIHIQKPDGIFEPVGFFGVNYILVDETHTKKSAMDAGNGRESSIARVLELETRVKDQAIELENTKADLLLAKEQVTNLLAEVKVLEEERNKLITAKTPAAKEPELVKEPKTIEEGVKTEAKGKKPPPLSHGQLVKEESKPVI